MCSLTCTLCLVIFCACAAFLRATTNAVDVRIGVLDRNVGLPQSVQRVPEVQIRPKYVRADDDSQEGAGGTSVSRYMDTETSQVVRRHGTHLKSLQTPTNTCMPTRIDV